MAKQVRGNRNSKGKSQRNGPVRKRREGPRIGPSRPRRGPDLISNSKFKTKLTPKVQDARQKLLQKKRNVTTSVVTDARDVLSKKVKILDARNKLDRIRGGRGGVNTNIRSVTTSPKVKVIGSSILQKVDRNGKISLITNKARHNSDINLAIKKHIGLIEPSRSQMKRSPPKKVPPTKISVPIRKTIVNEMNYGVPIVDPLAGMYKWVNPELRPASHLIGSLDTTRQAMRDVMREELLLANRGWSDLITPKPMRLQPSGYIDLDAIDEDEDMPMAHSASSRIALKGSQRVSNVHSRLDSLPSKTISHGILGQPKTKVVVPAGHRIVVSNLQSSVTEDDIKELFEDIGQLLSAKLVRPGVAEVIYKNLKDAQTAVDTYHNRQLDGQPMKCLLVNKRPLNQPTAAPLPKTEGFLNRNSSVDASSKLVPDISTIHKVLFHKNK